MHGLYGLAGFGKSLAYSGLESARSAGNSLTRSLIGHSPLYDRSNANRFSAAQRFMHQNDAGQNKTVTEFGREEAAHGKDIISSGKQTPNDVSAAAASSAAALAKNVLGSEGILNAPSASGKEKPSSGKGLVKENEPLKSGAAPGKNSN
jgi:hypothetical protein